MGLLGTGLAVSKLSFAYNPDFPIVRVAKAKRRFVSQAIEEAIQTFKANVPNKELGWLFENCFPNTLDTTVSFSINNNRPDTYIITGDIDAMWQRDSSAQVWPYLQFIQQDPQLKQLIAGTIYRQTAYILKDPYANAFYNNANRVGEWKDDLTDMKPGIHERKWEIDSLCYPIRLANKYYELTKDALPFDDQWEKAIELIYQTFVEQQRKTSVGPYKFQRNTAWGNDSVVGAGYGNPGRPVGLITSVFRPSDDATIFPYLVPANFFAVVSLRQAARLVKATRNNSVLSQKLSALADEVALALQKYAVVSHPQFGKIYAFEVDGYGGINLMDDANVPSLLSMPYLGAVSVKDKIYQNTRRFVHTTANPYFFSGIADGIGGPHIGKDYIWPMSIIMRALTSTSDIEIKQCIAWLQKTHGHTGFMHESFHKDNPAKFTRSWFAWANTLFGELMWKLYNEKPHLLK